MTSLRPQHRLVDCVHSLLYINYSCTEYSHSFTVDRFGDYRLTDLLKLSECSESMGSLFSTIVHSSNLLPKPCSLRLYFYTENMPMKYLLNRPFIVSYFP